MNLFKVKINYRSLACVICGVLILVYFNACHSNDIQTPSDCVFEPCTSLNLYKEEVIYRLVYAQNALIYGPKPAFHSYDPSKLRKQIDDLFTDSRIPSNDWWTAMRIRFEEFWFSLPGIQEELDQSEWIRRNLDLMSTAYAFEILPYQIRRQLYPLIAGLVEEREELKRFWRNNRVLLPRYIEPPRINRLSSLTREPQQNWKNKLREKEPLIIAHRGGLSRFPENSLSAIQYAYQSGSDGIECDLRLSSDGNAVVLHDENLFGLTHQNVRTSLQSLDSLLKLRLRDPFHLRRMSSQPPLTLRTLFKELGGRLLLWLELKPVGDIGLPNRVGKLVREFHLEDSVIVSSLDPSMLAPLRKSFKKLRIAFEFNNVENQIKLVEKLIKSADRDRIIISCKDFQSGKESLLKSLQKKSISSSTFTPNRFDALTRSIKKGITLIQTDRPDRARLLLAELP